MNVVQDPVAGIPTATKTAFTRECNKTSRVVHSGILAGEAKRGKMRGGGGGGDDDDDEDGDGEEKGDGDGEEGDADGDGGEGGGKAVDDEFEPPKKIKISAKRLAAIGFVAKDDGKTKKKPAAAKKKPAPKKK